MDMNHALQHAWSVGAAERIDLDTHQGKVDFAVDLCTSANVTLPASNPTTRNPRAAEHCDVASTDDATSAVLDILTATTSTAPCTMKPRRHRVTDERRERH